MDRCGLCEFRDNCKYANYYDFCDDCKYGGGCPLRSASCKAGYDIECNNGFEDKELWEDEDEEEEE